MTTDVAFITAPCHSVSQRGTRHLQSHYLSRFCERPQTAAAFKSRQAIRCTSAESLPKAPLAISPESSPFVAALRSLFSGISSENAFLDLLDQNVTWENPVLTVQGHKQVFENLGSFFSFALEPKIHIVADVRASEEQVITWLISFVYPLPWRPRVLMAGVSRIFYDVRKSDNRRRLATRIVDQWDASPWCIIRQSLPKIQDIIWLWPSPHAEVDAGLRKTISSSKAYSIIEVAEHPEFRIRAELKDFDYCTIWGTPALPEEAYVGEIRRLEPYEAVSPIAVRNLEGNFFEWAVFVSGSFYGTDVASFSHPAENASFQMTPRTRMAVLRFRGFANIGIFQEKKDELLHHLVKDKVLSEEAASDESRVWSRQYDCKLGFNSNGLPTLSTYGFSQGIPRVNEVAVILNDEYTWKQNASQAVT